MALQHILALVAEIIFLGLTLAQDVPINTPTPMQTPAYADCEQFYQAIPGETCDSLTAKANLPRWEVLRINPALNRDACDPTVLAGHWYCVRSKGKPQAEAQRPSLPVATGGLAQQLKDALRPPPSLQDMLPPNGGLPELDTDLTLTKQPRPWPNPRPPKPTKGPDPPEECSFNYCWWAFVEISTAKNTDKSAAAVQSCHALFTDVGECKFDELDFPGIIKENCPACEVLRSACPCFTAGRYHTQTLHEWYSWSQPVGGIENWT